MRQITAGGRHRLRGEHFDGFCDGFRGDPTGEAAIVAKLHAEAADERAVARAELERATARREEAREALSEAEARLPSSRPTDQQERQPILRSFLWAPIYLAAAVTFFLGEVALWRLTAALVFELPLNGPDAWHNWAFSIGLAAMAIPIEIALDRLVLSRDGGPSSRPGRGLKIVLNLSCLLAVGALGLAASMRWLFMRFEGLAETLPLDTPIEPLFVSHPVSTLTALVVASLAFMVSAAWAIHHGVDHCSRIGRFVGQCASRLRGAGAAHAARRRVARRRRRWVRTTEDLAKARSTQESADERHASELDHTLELYRSGHAAGVRAGGAFDAPLPADQIGHLAVKAYYDWLGYRVRERPDGGLDLVQWPSTEEPAPIAAPMRPSERMRADLSARIAVA